MFMLLFFSFFIFPFYLVPLCGAPFVYLSSPSLSEFSRNQPIEPNMIGEKADTSPKNDVKFAPA